MGANTELSLKIAEAQVRAHREASVELERALKAAQDELAYLRTVVTEKFARDIEVAVKPEDAADVAKWAANPEAVRELLKHTPKQARLHYNEYEGDACIECEGRLGEFEPEHAPTCPVFLAWAALDDPRAAEAIGAAFDRARPVSPQPFNHGGGSPEWQRDMPMRVEPMPVVPVAPFRDGTPRCGAEIPLGSGMATRCRGRAGHAGDHHYNSGDVVYRLASESEQAAR